MTSSRMARPKTTGRLRVTSGIRGPETAFAEETATLGARLLPQTEQRVALMPRRVPQVGQIFVVFGWLSGLIVPLTKYRGDPRSGGDYTTTGNRKKSMGR